MNYHKILGITPSASPEEIKKAYRRLARKHHPDVNPNDPNAAAKFIEIREAYEGILAQRSGGTSAQTYKYYTRPKNEKERKEFSEKEELYRFIRNLEQLCIRIVHKERDPQMRALVKNYLQRVWNDDTVRKINAHSSVRERAKIMDLTYYLFKMVPKKTAHEVSRHFQYIARENKSLAQMATDLKFKVIKPLILTPIAMLFGLFVIVVNESWFILPFICLGLMVYLYKASEWWRTPD